MNFVLIILHIYMCVCLMLKSEIENTDIELYLISHLSFLLYIPRTEINSKNVVQIIKYFYLYL